ncbi:putative vacuolar amino acid transporter YPQ3 [Cytospora mali]|uniref:Vacuolar amino acid transporter YPQ3 n=1 Tax=Cytospora mali TaxID=578113 RepID=A0A194VLV6_CYTMA|nr:putative vacuolar amino acid transporter YPQ3 [Valsa mali]
MAPPTEPLNLDIDAISGICGSISIACWVVVFSPQIIENFRRRAADGLSLHFVIIWLLGDVFNILGAVLQGVLPTMIILAIYYTIADVVLLGQCFYYRGFTWKDEAVPPAPKKRNHHANGENGFGNGTAPNERTSLLERRDSDWSDSLIHVNPVVPIVEPSAPPPPPATLLQAIAWNTVAVIMVIGAGVAGWAVSRRYNAGKEQQHNEPEAIHLDLWGQIFGYLCAALYLGSRLPQLLLNWRRKSTEGLSMLFFLFACLGNLTYALSIFAFDPKCYEDDSGCKPGEARRIYGQYILLNSSWLAGSVGTLFLDMGVFIQFFMYNKGDDVRPVLERNQSEWST